MAARHRLPEGGAMSFSNSRLSVLNLGDQFRTADLEADILEYYQAKRIRDAYQIPGKTGEAWVFNYGVAVFWGCDDDEQQDILKRITPHLEDQASKRAYDHFTFSLNAGENSIQADKFVLAGDDPLQRLAVSHALAQSIQLNVFETMAEDNIRSTADIPRSLAQTGRMKLGRKAIAKIRGHLFSTKSDIILHYGLLDTPEFFWEYPALESLYNQAARYLDIRPRVDVLSQKLQTIHELLEMLADEQNHRHSAFLEWIIILLIAFEIVMMALP
ncbi:RMD1 family protein [Litorivivens sp.]|uniref:RMD1 family protein n=1 Tax=Litorivivens sp. TaxID=2020868 RepID=UPI00356911DA